MKYLPLILGMALVTYVPRFMPLMILRKSNINERFRLFLTFIPYTSLSILLIRGVLTAEASMRLPTILGILVASLIAYKHKNLILSVLAGILTAFVSINFLSF